MSNYNKYDKEILKQSLEQEPFDRVTVSFYRYVAIENPTALRDTLYEDWFKYPILGRVYLANEGVNAQISIPEPAYNSFITELYSQAEFTDVPIKIAVEEDVESFLKLQIKVRKKIVADGLDGSIDTSKVGAHLTAEQFHEHLGNEDVIAVDMRNHYEYEVGHFEGAVNLDVDTFREALPKALEELDDKKDKKLLLYCTGGIRCEKASAYLKHHGFEDVNQLYGGIIEYAHFVKQEEQPSKFKGKNFVFDDRLGERITEEVLSNCHVCGETCDTHTNCANDACHILFIQCEKCAATLNGCCTEACKDFLALPLEEQIALRKGNPAKGTHRAYTKGRVRPKLWEME